MTAERKARVKFAAALNRLRAEVANCPSGRVSDSQIARKVGTTPQRLSDWFRQGVVPPDDVVWGVIGLLEERLGRPFNNHQLWEELLRAARDEAKSQQGGRPNKGYRPTAPPPLRYIDTANKYRLQELKGDRIRAELERLEKLLDSRSGYLSLEAPPWSGKTALLATFAATAALPTTDLVAYFVRWKTGSSTAQHFRNTMLDKLRKFTKKRPAAKDNAALLEMYETAARKSAEHGRKLLLVIDGLDEDAESSSGGGTGESIASLLPARLYPGMTVLVARRRHPDLPHDVPSDHPLRHAYQIAFQPFPEADVQRSVALRDLAVLLNECGTWGREVVGFLAVAGGGLSESALMQLIETGEHREMPIPFDLTVRLHSVTGRGFSPEELDPDEYVLAHEELYRHALEALGLPLRSALLRRLHAWADGYSKAGWPDSTPGYLLHRYLDLLSTPDEIERRTAFTLDHRRLLQLAARGRTDLALSALEDLARAVPSTVVLASSAASKSLLKTAGKPVPREILEALCMVGDGERARSLALRAGDPLSKASRLADVARTLSITKRRGAKEQAKRFVQEAAEWAEKAEYERNLLSSPSEWDAPSSIIPAIAIVMAELGLVDDAMRLLGQVNASRPENIEPAARASVLLREANQVSSDRVMDELMLEAESQAESEEGNPVLAVQIWASVAMHDSERSMQALLKMTDLSKQLAVTFPGLAAAECCAITASAMARSAVENRSQARALANSAKELVLGVQDDGLDDELAEAAALLVRAFIDLGDPYDKIRGDLAAFPEAMVARAKSLICDTAAVEEEEDEKEATLLRLLQRSSELGDVPRLRRQLDQYVRSAFTNEGYVIWLPFLSEALVDVDSRAGSALVRLTREGGNPMLQVRVLTAAARAHAERGALEEAHRCAADAAETVAGMDPQTPEARALVAQAFAHADEAARAAPWTRAVSGTRPPGRAGISYRRAALAIQAGLEPAAFVGRVLTEGLSGSGIMMTGSWLIEAFSELASGATMEARIAVLSSTARARLTTEPLLATGLALLQAVDGDDTGACRTVREVPNPRTRGAAQAAVARYLLGKPAYLEVDGDEDSWTLSVLCVIAHHMSPVGINRPALVPNLVIEALGTESWYRTLPLLSRTDSDALQAVVEVLDRHR